MEAVSWTLVSTDFLEVPAILKTSIPVTSSGTDFYIGCFQLSYLFEGPLKNDSRLACSAPRLRGTYPTIATFVSVDATALDR